MKNYFHISAIIRVNDPPNTVTPLAAKLLLVHTCAYVPADGDIAMSVGMTLCSPGRIVSFTVEYISRPADVGVDLSGILASSVRSYTFSVESFVASGLSCDVEQVLLYPAR